MADVGRHPNIELLTLSEVKAVSGYVGNFRVKVRRHARYVDEKECTACGDCAKVCPQVKPDEFNFGLVHRHAIYQPFPQAIPAAYVLDMETCLGNNPRACGKCVEACEKHCIDLDATDLDVEFTVGTIVIATGMESFDPLGMTEYGYGRMKNVITAMEFERLASSGGPTGGDILRFSDSKRPNSIAFIQCVGSRCEGPGHSYCGNICCMNTIKDSLLLKDHWPDVDVRVYYIDLRAFGKGFEEMLKRSRQLGVRYIRGIPGEVEENEDQSLTLHVENTETGLVEQHQADMVVLATGVQPRAEAHDLNKLLSLQLHPDGFLLEAHPKLQPVDSPVRGIFYAGCAEGPKDIKESVTQASAAAGRATRLMSQGEITADPYTVEVDEDKCKACGLCLKVCPYGAFDWEKGAKAKPLEALCAGCGTCAAECRFDAITPHQFSDAQIMAQVQASLARNPEQKAVVFACNWCSYAAADTAGVSRFQYPANQVLIRTMCSGRVDEKFILRAFELGAPLVLVSGCHFVDCHYIDANRATQKRVEKLWDKLESWGIRPERLQLEWISSAQGQRFQKSMEWLDKLRREVTPREIAQTRRILKQKLHPPKPKKQADRKGVTANA
jgi:heterodisulfide reductase subunit A